MKFRKKPIVIEAFQMTREHRATNAEWLNWMHEAWMLDRETPGSLYPTEAGTGNGNGCARLTKATTDTMHPRLLGSCMSVTCGPLN